MHRRFKRLASRLQSVSTPWRITFGLLLLLGGALWFLPILGLWMIPLGLLVLSVGFSLGPARLLVDYRPVTQDARQTPGKASPKKLAQTAGFGLGNL